MTRDEAFEKAIKGRTDLLYAKGANDLFDAGVIWIASKLNQCIKELTIKEQKSVQDFVMQINENHEESKIQIAIECLEYYAGLETRMGQFNEDGKLDSLPIGARARKCLEEIK